MLVMFYRWKPCIYNISDFPTVPALIDNDADTYAIIFINWTCMFMCMFTSKVHTELYSL